MAGLRDGLALVRYRAQHIETETTDPEEFLKRMKAELELIGNQMENLRGSQLAEILCDGG